MTNTSRPGMLDGIKVIDLTSVIFGPLATQMLGDLGADVIKIESPEGDMLREVQPARSPGMGAAYLGVNRNKRSVCLDLKKPEDRDRLLEMLKDADVFASSIRPAALERLSLAPADLAKINPNLITVATIGFGTDGPYRDKPAYDDIVQSVSGLAGLAKMRNPDAAPDYAPTVLADKLGGVTTAYAIMAALLHRERTGQAQHVEVPMYETLASFLLVEHMSAATFEDVPKSFGYQRMLVPHRRPLQTADGYITLLPYTNQQWSRFFTAIDRPDMLDHPWVTDLAERSRNIGGLYDLVSQLAIERTTAQWVSLMEAADIPVMPVQMMEDLPSDPHLEATGFFQQVDHPSEGKIWTTQSPIRFSKTPADINRLHAPRLGEHQDLCPPAKNDASE